MASAEPQAVQRAHDGVGLHTCLAWQYGQSRQKRRQAAQARRKHIGQFGQQQCGKQKPGPACERRVGDQQNPQGSGQAAQQIVPDFTAGQRVQRAPGRAPLRRKQRQHIGKQLPVAPRPAVETVKEPLEGFGIAVIENDIAGHGTARQFAFQQIMAEHAAGDDVVFGGVQKGRGIDDALAHERTPPVEILRKVGGEGVVGVCATASAQQQG